MLISTRLGAGQLIAHQAAEAVNPANPTSVTVVPPPDPTTLRQQVQGDTDKLLLLLAGLALIIGVVAIANTTLLTVFQRTPEFGLRRAIGARPRHIAAIILIEAAVVGAVGGIVGTAIGVFTTATVAIAEQWTAVLDLRLCFLAPIIGILAGLVAGVYPALRATRIQPIEALQR
jgi:putative ABC transport system permease protein